MSTTTSYGWAGTLNRTSVTVGTGTPVATTYDDANRPLAQAGVANAFASDADGRLTARPDAAGAAYQRLEWDHLGRLTKVKGPGGSTTIATYAYDPLDRLRVADYGASNRVRFRYQGLTTSAVQTINDQTGVVIRSIGTSWTGELLEDWTGTNANWRIYGTNGHHDITWTAGSGGTVTGTVRYDPWGTATSVTGSVPDFRFQSSWADDTTKLSWVVTRWYAPAQGTFISEDSLLGEPRDPDSRHLYAYGGGDPVGAWDPVGESQSLLGAPRAAQEWCSSSQRANLVCGFAVMAQRWAESRMFARWPRLPSGKNPSWNRGKADAFRHCCWNGAMVRLMGSGWARFVADELYEMNEPITSKNTFLNRHMDLFNNSQGRAIGSSVPATYRVHDLFGVEIWRQRVLDAEFNMVETGCLKALGRLQLLYLHQ